MRAALSVAFCAAFLIFQHASVLAQTLDRLVLKGLRSFKMVVENVRNNYCGLTADDITTSVRYIRRLIGVP